ncbi:unnamed protein product [Ceutorhynchus assimilis]|uniref:Uncharacterized protein n=1 Tax=Ceutorhynchus assimilis TaxID=467358 RepID=A0A9N9MZ82_9CUCU|nr:unnamed protein product [Ceutorhynchus assimilis]
MNILRDITIPGPSGLNSISSIKERAADIESSFEPSEESSRQDRTGSQKGKTFRYQRSERIKTAREKGHLNQSLMTDYFMFVEKICNSLTPDLTDIPLSRN